MKTLTLILNCPCKCHRCDHYHCCRSRRRHQRKITRRTRDRQKTQGNRKEKIRKQNRMDEMANHEGRPIFQTSGRGPQSPSIVVRSSGFTNLRLLGRTRSITGICGPQSPRDLEPSLPRRAMRSPGITNLRMLGRMHLIVGACGPQSLGDLEPPSLGKATINHDLAIAILQHRSPSSLSSVTGDINEREQKKRERV